MKRIVITLALLAAALLVPQPAQAMTPDAPARSCPGALPTDVPAQRSMFCAARTPARDNGDPYFVNYVDEVNGEQQFCVRSYMPADSVECHPYWPFRNPTVNGYRAPASAFDNGRLVATQATVDVLLQIEREQQRKIRHLKRELRHLRHHR